MKLTAALSLLASVLSFFPPPSVTQSPEGTELCKACHDKASFGGTQFRRWAGTLHARIHSLPDSVSVRPLGGFLNGDSVTMGPLYNNARVYLRKNGRDFLIKLGAAGPEYTIDRILGGAYTQRYLVRLAASYYLLPVQYNLTAYMDTGSYVPGNWKPYNAGNWYNADGSLKDRNTNEFRRTSWDKECMGCHVTGGRITTIINGADTSWSATWAMSSSDLNMAVGCEDCHGPYSGGYGPGHQMNPANLPSKNAKLEVCGQCHSRAQSQGGSHGYPRNEADNSYFNPADPSRPLAVFMDFTQPANTAGGPATWPDLKTARLNRQQYTEMMRSGHFNNPASDVTCFTCHVAHGTSPNRHAIVDSLTVRTSTSEAIRVKVSAEDNTLCLACHAGSRPFAAIPKSWVQNERAKRDSIGRVVNKHTRHETYDPMNLRNTGAIGRCTVCHMTKAALSATPYDLSTHSFAVIPPSRTIQFASVPNGMMNTCAASCHRNPSGPTSRVDDMDAGTDASLTNWAEATDLALARELWKEWLSWGLTGTETASGTYPDEFRLSPNYPNPFNPSTTIKFELPRSSQVKLSVFDILGREVSVLVNERRDAGVHEAKFDGSNLASGVYFYRLQAGDFVQARKLLMLR